MTNEERFKQMTLRFHAQWQLEDLEGRIEAAQGAEKRGLERRWKRVIDRAAILGWADSQLQSSAAEGDDSEVPF
jgi:hypothetical protein